MTKNIPAAEKLGKCSGCDKPFTAARKPRWHTYQGFISTSEGSAGRTGFAPVTLCGVCRAVVLEGLPPYELPGVAKAAVDLEQLVLADREGALQ